ncbi:MAG: excinuclease ABC subunit UvrA, partial [Nitrospinota bacterium]
MSERKIIIKGAREHNLKDIHLEIPRDKLIIITGLSGSGKSSLAFDTLYAEGQRRYVESLSAYARQFLDQMDKPDVDAIEGLSPAISIEQRTVSKNPRSTVGTVTEIYDHLRLLFARAGEPHCHECKLPIRSQTVQQMVDRVMALPSGVSLQVLAPIVRGRKGEYRKELNDMLRRGFLRARVDGVLRELDEEINLARNRKHTIEVVVDRLKVRPGIETRLADSIETSLRLAGGLAVIAPSGMDELLFSSKHSCPRCGLSFPELAPRMFSFNSPYGACPHCDGLGVSWDVDPELVVPDSGLSLREGALRPLAEESPWRHRRLLEKLEVEYGIDLDRPFGRLPKAQQQLILHGGDSRHRGRGGFEGVLPLLRERWEEWDPEEEESEVVEYMRMVACPACGGARLKPESLAVRVGGLSIADITRMSIKEASGFFNGLQLPA